MNSRNLNLTLISVAMTLTSLVSVSSAAQNANQSILNVTGNHEILQDVKEVTKKCAVELIEKRGLQGESQSSAGKVVGFESSCAELVLVSNWEAQVLVENQWYTAKLKDSPDADGGDLDNMSLLNQDGETVAVRTNVAAYDQVVLALVGGNTKLTQKEVTP